MRSACSRASSLALCLLVASCAAAPAPQQPISPSAELRRVLDDLALAWNAGDSTSAADCFTEDAVYTEPPDKQVYRGRQALHRFFGGDAGRPGAMTIVWHHKIGRAHV